MDAYTVIMVDKLGYKIRCVSDTEYWYNYKGADYGPFATIDDAAYAALSDYEMEAFYA